MLRDITGEVVNKDILNFIGYIPLHTTLPWVDSQYIADNLKKYILPPGYGFIPPEPQLYPHQKELLARYNFVLDIDLMSKFDGDVLAYELLHFLNEVLKRIKHLFPDGKECVVEIRLLQIKWSLEIIANVYEGGINVA